MDGPDSASEHDWIEKVKLGGAVPLIEPGDCPNTWATPPGDKFMVRGPEYFSSKIKIPGGDYLLRPLGVDWIKSPLKICEILNNPNSRVKKALDDELTMGQKPFVWIFNLQLPHKENYSAVAYFFNTEPLTEGSLVDQFVKGDDAFRNSRLKLIANIVKGPWIVKAAVGEQAVCILGKAVSCKYLVGEDYMEVDVDIGASVVANAIVHLAFGYITSLTVDLAFLIESQVELELPEQILGAVRFSELQPGSAMTVEPLVADENAGSLPSSLPTRLWKSIGQSFSHLMLPTVREGLASDNVNGGPHNAKNTRGITH